MAFCRNFALGYHLGSIAVFGAISADTGQSVQPCAPQNEK